MDDEHNQNKLEPSAGALQKTTDDAYAFFEQPTDLEALQKEEARDLEGKINGSDDLGAAVAAVTLPGSTDPNLVEHFRKITAARTSHCTTRREVFEVQIDVLNECVGIASEMYLSIPCTDNAYALASLENTYKSALLQLEKMKDPQQMLADNENLIQRMFTQVIRQLANEIDKTRRELLLKYPNDKSSVEDSFNRMLTAIKPETQKLFDDLDMQLRVILGIKKK